MIELRTFGALDLRDADGRELRAILAQPKRVALLVYLATTPGFHRRDTLLGLLWPDSDPSRARAALSRAVHYLRTFLGEGVLVSRGDDELGLTAELFSCDVVRFRAALQHGDYDAALDLYRGEFLEGFFLSDEPEFERWLDTARAELRTRATSAARTLSESAEQKGSLDLALHWARRASSLAPYDEPDMRRVVTLLDRTGDRAGAVDSYQRFERRLKEDLELETSEESRNLITAITSRDEGASAVMLPPAARPSRMRRRLITVAGLAVLGLSAAVLQSALSRADSKDDTPATAQSIAVLPFANLSADADNQFFTDGMTDELISALSEVSTLRVAARTSSFAFKDRDMQVKDIARELNVATVLEGSVRREGDQLRITVQLVDAERGYNLWSKTYERQLRDVFALQDEISREVVSALKIRLAGGSGPVASRTTDVETYDQYLWGRYYWNRRAHDELRKALGYFERAVARDPNYAPAFTGLADSYNLLVLFDLPEKQIMPKAKAAAERALALDDNESGAHAARAYIATWYDWDWPTAQTHYERALELNPSNATAHHWYSIYLAANGQLEDALSEIDRARELDPTSLFLRNALAMRLYFSRDYARAIQQFEQAIGLQPDMPAHQWVGVAYVKHNRISDAVRFLEKARATTNDRAVVVASLAIAYAAADRKADALKLIHQVEQRAEHEHFSVSWIARAYAAVGDNEHALDWLERAYDARDGWLTFLKVDPAFDALRSEPRFQRVLEKMGLS